MNRVYPKIVIESPKNPKKFYAIPFLGFIVKMFMLIPIGIELFFLFFYLYLLFVISSFLVLFTGKYFEPAYTLSLGIATLIVKISLFFKGITDKYPGFGLKHDSSLISIEKSKKHNRWFAFPFFGGLVRIIILIPYFIFGSILSYASWFGILYAVKPVLFDGKYPEITYEIVLDTTRVGLAPLFYWGGILDTYPSFRISMNHKKAKIALLILGVLMFLFSQSPHRYR